MKVSESLVEIVKDLKTRYGGREGGREGGRNAKEWWN